MNTYEVLGPSNNKITSKGLSKEDILKLNSNITIPPEISSEGWYHNANAESYVDAIKRAKEYSKFLRNVLSTR